MFLRKLAERRETKKAKAAKEKMAELQGYSIAHGLPIPFRVEGDPVSLEEIEEEIAGAKTAVACAEAGMSEDIFAQKLDFIRVGRGW